MYAVIELQGHQYIIKENDTLVVDRLTSAQGEELSIDSVLCIFDPEGSSVKVGTPYIDGASVQVSVDQHQKGEKINVLKFHRKNRYERNRGFRPYQTVLTIGKINA